MTQLPLRERPRRGGKRKNAGRKPGARPKVLHRARPVHKHWNPVHVTMRAARGLPSLRAQAVYPAIEAAVRGTKRADFRIVEFSVQSDHVHAIVEAFDKDALSRGMRSFSVRVVRRVNRVLRRRSGRLWGDRYHRRDLTSPRQVRHALVYVLMNFRKHEPAVGSWRLDACSSAPWFDGWIAIRKKVPDDPPVERARTVLLRRAWQKHGLLHPGEAPKVRSARS
jgi:putative transposase